MSANQTLERLISGMDMKERHRLLERIRAASALPPDAAAAAAAGDGAAVGGAEARYERLPWFVRLLYRIVGLFTGRTAARVHEDRRLRAIAAGIVSDAPGIFDPAEGRLLEGFHDALVGMKDAARFFYNVLDNGINRDRGAFLAVLGSLEMGDVHLRLQACASRETLHSRPAAGLRASVLREMDETLQSIPEAKRTAMYRHVRSLGHLKELSCFLFDRFILAFGKTNAGKTCRIDLAVKQLLTGLDGILFSLRDQPSLALIESFFVYELETRAGEPGFDMERETAELLDRAGRALTAIRGFGARVPLSRIIRCVTRNPAYRPVRAAGGEDWLAAYRNYWKRQIETALGEFLCERRRENVVGRLAERGVVPGGFSSLDALQLPEAFALSAVRGFDAEARARLDRALRPILSAEEFARPDEGICPPAFTDGVTGAAQRILILEEKLSAGGEYGRAFALARIEAAPAPVRRRKVNALLAFASEEAEGILSAYCEGATALAALFESVLGNGVTENSGLSGLRRLAETSPTFAKDAAESAEALRFAVRVLGEIDAVEMDG